MTILLMAAGVVEGATIWSNGAVSVSTPPQACDSSSACSGIPGPFTVFDSFTVAAGGNWSVTSFDFSDFFVNSSTSQYTSTTWSIWKGDPLNGGLVVAAGNSVASLGTPNCTLGPKMCLVQLTVGGISVSLSSGIYYLGTTNLTGGAVLERAVSAGNGLPGYEGSNGGDPNSAPPVVGSTWASGTSDSSFFPADSAFDISGVVVPEPGALTFMGLGLAGLWMGRRRSQA